MPFQRIIHDLLGGGLAPFRHPQSKETNFPYLYFSWRTD